MKPKILIVFVAVIAALVWGALFLVGQDIKIFVTGGEAPKIAVPDFRGSGEKRGNHQNRKAKKL